VGDRLARCPFPGCPFRWRSGEDRLCADHAGDAGAVAYDRRKDLWNGVAASSTSQLMTAPPGGDG
jgi:hypothetical protein